MITDPKTYTAIAWVMTLGILPSILLTPILIKKIQKGIIKIQTKDSSWGNIFMTSLFMGMISAFSGMVFSHLREGLKGLLPVIVLFISAAIMAICGLLIKKAKITWLEMPFGGQIARNVDLETLEGFLQKLSARTSIGEILKIKANAQNIQIVDNQLDAEEVFDYQWALDTAKVSGLLMG